MKQFWFLFLSLFLMACTDAVFIEEDEWSAGTLPAGDTAEVVYVTDGDTITVAINGKEYKVRYVGVDTPERDEPYYQEATQFNRDLVAGEWVTLVKDVSDTDQYGRLLRYVYLDDGTFVNEQLVANGYARVVTYAPDVANADYFADLQRQARESSLGLWGVNDFTSSDSQSEAPAGCNLCNRNVYNCRDFDSQSAAQACYAFCYEIAGEDIHRLDGGGDGVVCESLAP